jgi:integrase
MWHVAYSSKAEHQGQSEGFIPRDTLPNDEQCAAIFAAFIELGSPAWSLGMRLASRSGVRWGELIALRGCDVDFEPHRIVRVQRAVEQSSRGLSFKMPKNAQKRTTMFPASLGADLAAHVAAVRAQGGDHALLFPGRNGEPPERRQFLRLWHRAARRAGWPMRSSTAAIWHPHDLRHVAACWMLFDVGIDPALVARMLGHAHAAFTLSRYVGVRTGADAATNLLTDNW